MMDSKAHSETAGIEPEFHRLSFLNERSVRRAIRPSILSEVAIPEFESISIKTTSNPDHLV
jgi:hypothetical protein